MPKFSQISIARLNTCDVRLQDILYEAIKVIDFSVLEGHRGETAQNLAVRTGHSKLPWPKGKHNKFPSQAVDIWPWTPEGKIDWKDVVAAGRLMGYVQRIAEEQGVELRFGLDWDGDFRTAGIADPNEMFLDAPHIEIKE